MADQATVNQWLAEFLARLRQAFGQRLLFVGHHGSWARGEATPDSDIDTMVILDHIEAEDLAAYRDVISNMADGGRMASGLFNSVAEMQARPRSEAPVQYFYGCKVLHGSMAGIVGKPTNADLMQDIRAKASYNLLATRHYLLFPHDLRQKVHSLCYPFKESFYALQEWILVQSSQFFARKTDLLQVLNDEDDRAVVAVARDWRESEADRTARPLCYFELLERWSRSMVARVSEHASPSHGEAPTCRG
ncbi:MAG TPA: nucleotidyltransferase domain-containing protein [Armatimonadota bacterium]|nr:nucleotidyltransferase domain-containing protein [Armatimonadota bacterium]